VRPRSLALGLSQDGLAQANTYIGGWRAHSTTLVWALAMSRSTRACAAATSTLRAIARVPRTSRRTVDRTRGHPAPRASGPRARNRVLGRPVIPGPRPRRRSRLPALDVGYTHFAQQHLRVDHFRNCVYQTALRFDLSHVHQYAGAVIVGARLAYDDDIIDLRRADGTPAVATPDFAVVSLSIDGVPNATTTIPWFRTATRPRPSSAASRIAREAIRSR
jgi:hypothetical protein